MSPSPKEGEEVLCELSHDDNGNVSGAGDGVEQMEESTLRKRLVESCQETPAEGHGEAPPPGENRLEVLYDGYYYDVTEFISRHPGGEVMNLYTDTKEDATIAITQFHYRSMKTVLAKMKGLKRRVATDEEIGLDPETKKRHDHLTKEFLALQAEVEAEGLMEPDPRSYAIRIGHCIVMFSLGFAMSYWLGASSLLFRGLGILLMSMAGGQSLWLMHQGGHNAFTGNPKIDRVVQTFNYGFVFGLSASCWNHTHTEHHAMPQHETKDADLKTMPLLAFNKKIVRDPKDRSKFWLHYQHLLFVLCDTLIVTLTWKFNHHLRFVIKNKCWLDLVCMISHYSILPVIGFVDWMLITWIVSIYILGNLVLNHTHLPIVEEGRKLHWVEYALTHTMNCKSSYFGWVDWWTGHLNYQIEHHLFPTMPEYKSKLCRDKVKAFAKRNDLPYQLCSYWEAVKSAYFNLEHVANEIRQL